MFGKIKQFYESKSKAIYAIKMIIINTFIVLYERDQKKKVERIEKGNLHQCRVVYMCVVINIYIYCDRKAKKIYIA